MWKRQKCGNDRNVKKLQKIWKRQKCGNVSKTMKKVPKMCFNLQTKYVVCQRLVRSCCPVF